MNLIEVTSLSDPRLDVFARLTEAQLRNKLEPEKGIFIAESPKVIVRALDEGLQPLSYLMERKWLETAAPLIDRSRAEDGGEVPVFTGPSEELAKLTGFTLTRGVLCAFRRPALPSVEGLLAGARRVAVLEGIVDHIKAPEVNACYKLAIVLGTEGDGLAPRTIAQCDYTVKIPMRHHVDSLNVAAASAVAFYQFCQ